MGISDEQVTTAVAAGKIFLFMHHHVGSGPVLSGSNEEFRRCSRGPILPRCL